MLLHPQHGARIRDIANARQLKQDPDGTDFGHGAVLVGLVPGNCTMSVAEGLDSFHDSLSVLQWRLVMI
jgi:hypothetical protein